MASSVASIITFLNLVVTFSYFIVILFTVSFSLWLERYPERSSPPTIVNLQFLLMDLKSQYRLYFLQKSCYQYEKWKNSWLNFITTMINRSTQTSCKIIGITDIDINIPLGEKKWLCCNSCAQVHELPQSHWGDNREGTLFWWFIYYIYIIYLDRQTDR